MKFNDGFKKEMVRKMLMPGGKGVKSLSLEIGVHPATLYNWRDKFSKYGVEGQKGNSTWTAKVQNVLEYASVPETEKGEWLRRKGFKSEQLLLWEKELITMNDSTKYREELQLLRQRNKQLEKEVLKKDKALAELSAIIVLQKKNCQSFQNGRGAMTSLSDRHRIIADIDQAVLEGAGTLSACASIHMNSRTLLRWRKDTLGDKRPLLKKEPANKLSKSEEDEIIKVCFNSVYKDMTPNEIVPKLAENGQYIASEATFYRVLRKSPGIKKTKRVIQSVAPKALIATGPNQVWTWDITYLCSPVKDLYYYLYLVTDIWSRKIIGWRIHDSESAELGANLIRHLCVKYAIKHLDLHSDNGAPMRGSVMLATLQRLGVMPSFSRPGSAMIILIQNLCLRP